MRAEAASSRATLASASPASSRSAALREFPQRDLFGRCEVSERGFFRCAELDDNAVRLFRGLEDGPERRAYFLFKIAGKRLYVIVQPANVAQQFKRERVPCRAGNVCRVHRAPLI